MTFFVRQIKSANFVKNFASNPEVRQFHQKSIFSSQRPVFVISSLFCQKRNFLEPFIMHSYCMKILFRCTKVTNRGLFLRWNTQSQHDIWWWKAGLCHHSGQFVLFKIAHQCLKCVVCRHWSNSPVWLAKAAWIDSAIYPGLRGLALVILPLPLLLLSSPRHSATRWSKPDNAEARSWSSPPSARTAVSGHQPTASQTAAQHTVTGVGKDLLHDSWADGWPLDRRLLPMQSVATFRGRIAWTQRGMIPFRSWQGRAPRMAA